MDKKIKALLKENSKLLDDFWDNNDPIPKLKENNNQALALLNACPNRKRKADERAKGK